MHLVAHNSVLLLERRDTVELIDAAGATASLLTGCLWITMDGDTRDIVLGAGQSWRVERNGRTLVHAGAPSVLRITEPAPVRREHLALALAPGLGALGVLRIVGEWAERIFRRPSAPYY